MFLTETHGGALRKKKRTASTTMASQQVMLECNGVLKETDVRDK